MASAVAERSSHAYRREARRLRGRLAHRPVQLYYSLRNLSDRQDALDRDFAEMQREAGPQPPAADFARLAVAAIDGGVLSYSKRLKLLDAADGLDIGRFQANLIIAAVQHGTTAASIASPRNSRRRPSPDPSYVSRFAVAPLLVFLLVQALITLGAWLIFLR